MKKTLIVTALIPALLAASPASAAIYEYTSHFKGDLGDVDIVINTETLTTTWTGQNINLVMTDSDLADWNPVLYRWGKDKNYVDSATGWFRTNGKVYDAQWSSSPKHTQFQLGWDYGWLWIYGVDDQGKRIDYDTKGSYGTEYTSTTGGTTTSSTGGTTTTSGGSTTTSGGSTTTSGGSTTTSGGSTTTSGGSTTTTSSGGGTPIPEPGMLGLLGLGLFGVGFMGRRRREHVSRAVV